MKKNDKQITTQKNKTEFLIYTDLNKEVKVGVVLREQTIWLNQKQMAKLFGVNVPAISKHLKNIYNEGELQKNATVSILETVQKEGKKEVARNMEFYNLDAILSVGYRINSREATNFRIWATKTLKEYVIKGFAIDDQRLKNGAYFGQDYFKELLETVRSIRASERRVYQQITDIFAECSIDYDPKSEITRNFYATVQNKFHFAIVEKTAAEIIYDNTNKKKPFMGLTTWKNAPKGRILKSDAMIAKNYLQEDEIKKLERAISGYFDYIERLIENRTSFTMEKLAESVNKFLQFNEYKVLDGKGKISNKQAKQKASLEYEKFNKTQKIESDFDKEIKKILKENSKKSKKITKH
ncbi:MAG: virulence RhuM family protein [Deltaproteobacteria bacterium]|nr:virulence RhuM family protein [Deltaproteobacteria bacterium]